jgi:hypothetical protein
MVTKHNFDQEYLEYDAERQLELEGYGVFLSEDQ